MENINSAKISGVISDIRHSQNNTYFVSLKQQVLYNNELHPITFEVAIFPEHQEIIDKLQINATVIFEGTITVFKLRKYGIYKQVINASKIEIIK
uniref:Single-stranded DNA-binding protein n=1 Tax=uncultured Mycoplasmataceae bacterium TaxID=300027 RepID=A0A6G9HHB1_9MOLU|nr:hypothetical protein PlMoll_0280 [uncultured Mycoplasmataceae bacterium]